LTLSRKSEKSAESNFTMELTLYCIDLNIACSYETSFSPQWNVWLTDCVWTQLCCCFSCSATSLRSDAPLKASFDHLSYSSESFHFLKHSSNWVTLLFLQKGRKSCITNKRIQLPALQPNVCLELLGFVITCCFWLILFSLF